MANGSKMTFVMGIRQCIPYVSISSVLVIPALQTALHAEGFKAQWNDMINYRIFLTISRFF